MTETGHLAPYAQSADAQYAQLDDAQYAGPAEDEYLDDDGDHEPVEDGLQGSRERGAVAVAQRLGRRPRDMIISMAVLLAILFAVFGLYRVIGGDDATIDPGPAYAQARADGGFPVQEPTGLAAGWRPVSAAFQPQSTGSVLRIGYRTPDDGTVQLVQANTAPDTLLAFELGDAAKPTGVTETVNGAAWQVYDARKGERALVLQAEGRTVVIVGKAEFVELRELAASLK
jgi:hypothetical protein